MDVSETTTGAGRRGPLSRSPTVRVRASWACRRAAGRGASLPGSAAWACGGSGLPSASNNSILAALWSCGDRVALRLLGDVARRLVLDLLEGREALGAHALDLDDVPAELGLDRLGNLALLQLERGLGEFRHHAVLGEPAEVAAVAGRVLGELGRHLGEVLAALDAGERRLRLVLGRQQDVAGVDFLLAAARPWRPRHRPCAPPPRSSPPWRRSRATAPSPACRDNRRACVRTPGSWSSLSASAFLAASLRSMR